MNKLSIAILASVFCASGALAQVSGQGGPIRVKADRSEVLDRDRQVILIDNVDITQGNARLRADRVTLSYSGEGSGQSSGLAANFGELQSMEARGNVFYVTPDFKATGDSGIYEAGLDTITLSGDVVLLRGDDVAKGSTLTLDLARGLTMLDGGVNMVITPAEEDSLLGSSATETAETTE